MNRGVFASIIAAMVIALITTTSTSGPPNTADFAVPQSQQLANDFETAVYLLDQNVLAFYLGKISGTPPAVGPITNPDKIIWRNKLENTLWTSSALSAQNECGFYQNPLFSQPTPTTLRVVFILECNDSTYALRIRRQITLDKSFEPLPPGNGFAIKANGVVQYAQP